MFDVLYKFGNVAHAPIDDDKGEQEDHAPVVDDEGEQEDKELFDCGLTTAILARGECPAFTPEIGDVLKKVRKVVKVFRKSTVKNEVLQKYVMQEHEKELSLILYCKNRWSSMFQMIERFILLKKCIFKALLDLSIAHDITQAEFLFLDEMKAALESVKLAVEAMCRQNATLLTAEEIFLFLIRKMKKRRTTLAKKLLSAVKNCIKQRRKTDLIDLMRYLQNPNAFSQHDTNDIFDDEPLSSTTKESFLKTATTLISSLFGDGINDKADGQQTQQDANEEVAANSRQVSLFKRLQTHIKHSTDFTDNQSDTQSDDRNQLQKSSSKK